MRIEDVLARFRVQKYASRGRDNRCICPVHDDRTGSLMIKVDDSSGKILIHCHAGCPVDDICKAAGITEADLNERELVPGHTVRTAAKQSKPRKTTQNSGKPVEKSVEKAAEDRPLPWPPAAVYHYTDEDGVLIFDVLRFQYSDGDKTFRQGIPDNTQRNGWRLGGVSDLRHPLYQLPDVVAAVQARDTVYVVEGEKDVHTLMAMGYTGTTNPGGASKPGQKIKWTEEHTNTLAGANVVIIPDVDATGLADRAQVGINLLGAGCTVRWIDLRKCGVTLPKKGDISDLAKLVGLERAKEILDRMVAAAKPCTVEDLETDEMLRARVDQLYNSPSVPGYCTNNGCLSRWEPDGPGKPLCTFMAIPSATVTIDNGITKHSEYIIKCWNHNGRRLDDVRVPAAEFGGQMRWLDTAWPGEVNINVGSTVRESIRHAMTSAGMAMGKRVTMYTHTGWRKINDRYVYLTQGGAIGADGSVSVELGNGKLSRYAIGDDKDWDKMDMLEALAAVNQLRQVMPGNVYTAAMAMVFLAPLREVMEDSGAPIRHLLYLYGKTGTGKSVVASLMLNFFGHFDGGSFPATFSGSIGHIRQCASVLKDSLMVVDDYYPSSNPQAKKRMDGMVDDISRMYGDDASRDILNPDSTMRTSTPARGVCVITGEMLPSINESGLQRFYSIQMEANSVPKNDKLTEVQQKASKGYLRKFMAGYLEWLIPQMDDLGDRLHERYIEYRARAQHSIKNAHARTPSNVAHMMLGYEMFIRYQMSVVGVDDDATMASMMETAWRDILKNTAEQNAEVAESNPATIYLSIIQEMVISGNAFIRDLEDIESLTRTPPKGLIGYKDARYYYLLPDVSYGLVCEHRRKLGLDFPLTERAVHQRMKEDDMLCPDPSGQPLRGKSIGGRTKRYLWIPRALFDGEGTRMQTEQMTMVGKDADNPF